jgi:hypothetical protein
MLGLHVLPAEEEVTMVWRRLTDEAVEMTSRVD